MSYNKLNHINFYFWHVMKFYRSSKEMDQKIKRNTPILIYKDWLQYNFKKIYKIWNNERFFILYSFFLFLLLLIYSFFIVKEDEETSNERRLYYSNNGHIDITLTYTQKKIVSVRLFIIKFFFFSFNLISKPVPRDAVRGQRGEARSEVGRGGVRHSAPFYVARRYAEAQHFLTLHLII